MQNTITQPDITVVFAFEPKNHLEKQLTLVKKTVLEKVETQIKQFEGDELIKLVGRLQAVMAYLNNDTSTRSVVIHLSPLEEKIFYLNYEVDERVIINEKFSLLNLTEYKKQAIEYLAIVLTSCHANIYTGDNVLLRRIATLTPDYTPVTPGQDACKTECHLANTISGKENTVNKFLQQVDNTLKFFLQSYPLPVFVFGSPRTVEYFKRITNYKAHIIDFFAGGYLDITETGIIELMQPWFKNWHSIKEANLLLNFEENFSAGKAFAGVKAAYSKSLA